MSKQASICLPFHRHCLVYNLLIEQFHVCGLNKQQGRTGMIFCFTQKKLPGSGKKVHLCQNHDGNIDKTPWGIN